MKKLLQGRFYYDPILGLRYLQHNADDIANNVIPNRSERGIIKIQKTTYKNKFGLNRNLY